MHYLGRALLVSSVAMAIGALTASCGRSGLGDLCAFSRAEYVDIAQRLAKDRARRLDLRHNLRANIRRSPLGDTQRWVKNFEATIERVVGRS